MLKKNRTVAIATAMTMLAISPAIAMVAQSQLDGLPRAIAAAVFGEPATAQECEAQDREGNPRDCTLTEEFSHCRWTAQESYLQCRERGGSYLYCDFFRGLNMIACDFEFIKEIFL